MRVLLTGATGYAGSAVLDRLLRRPDVDAVTVLTRRPIVRDDTRLTTLVHCDFTRYDDALLGDLAAHDAVIWALGAKSARSTDAHAYRRVTYDFPLYLARGIAERAETPTWFCYLSGMGATDRSAVRLPWQRLTRTVKGETERDLRRLGRECPGFRPVSFRPGGIVRDRSGRPVRLLLAPLTVTRRELADALIAVSLGTVPGVPDVVFNRDIQRLARTT